MNYYYTDAVGTYCIQKFFSKVAAENVNVNFESENGTEMQEKSISRPQESMRSKSGCYSASLINVNIVVKDGVTCAMCLNCKTHFSSLDSFRNHIKSNSPPDFQESKETEESEIKTKALMKSLNDHSYSAKRHAGKMSTLKIQLNSIPTTSVKLRGCGRAKAKLGRPKLKNT